MTDVLNGPDTMLLLDLPEAEAPPSAKSQKPPKIAKSQRGASAEASADLLPRDECEPGAISALNIVHADPRTIVADPVNVCGDVAFEAGTHVDLVASMRALGSTVPVVLRPSPDKSGRIGASLVRAGSVERFTFSAVFRISWSGRLSSI